MPEIANGRLAEEEIEAVLKRHIKTYSDATDRLSKLVGAAVDKLERTLAEKKILAKVTGRVKSRSSLDKKLRLWSKRPDKWEKISQTNGGSVFEIVGDLAAVRVMTYIESDRERVVKLIREESLFRSREGRNNFELERKENDPRIKDNPLNFYRATHLQVRLVEDDLRSDHLKNLGDDHFELQVTSMLAHVWNEIEHDIVYKPGDGALSLPEETALESLGMLAKAGDNIISGLINENTLRKEAILKGESKIKNEEHLVSFLQKFYGRFKVGNSILEFSNNSGTLFEALDCVDCLLPEKIKNTFSPNNIYEGYKDCKNLKKFMENEEKSRNLVDPLSCDTLFVVLLEAHDKVLLARKGHGLNRGISIGNNYKKWKKFCF